MPLLVVVSVASIGVIAIVAIVVGGVSVVIDVIWN